MAKFVFQLDGVLRHRERTEQEKRREFALVQAEMARLQAELKSLNEAVQSGTADARGHLVGTVDVNFLSAHRRFMFAMQRKGLALVQEMARQQKKVDDAQRALAEAAREKKVIEKLREKALDRWKAEAARKELADLDEINSRLGYENVVAGLEDDAGGADAEDGE